MRKLYLKQQNSSSKQTATTVRDTDGKAQYLVTGQFGRANAFVHIYNDLGELVVEMEQVSYGLLPRFEIKTNHETVGSIGLSVGSLIDVVYVRGLSWLINGSLATGIYHAYHGQELLLTVKPTLLAQGPYNELTITHHENEALLIGITVVLNRWLFNAKPSPLKNFLRHPMTLAINEKIEINSTTSPHH